jgi:death-on-curing protein
MITKQEALRAHTEAIEKHGGLNGVRDINLLESALERPFGGFGDMEFYPSTEEKAAAIVESIVKNHPFLDGNKRTGYILMRVLLLQGGLDIHATQDEKYDFVIQIASGELEFEAIVAWIKARLISI